jgi:hypothetical protein
MSTYLEMQTRIADELDRTDLTGQIQKAIQTAIAFYERKRFWFNEARSITFNTVDGQEFYTSADQSDIPNLLTIDFVKLTISGSDKVNLDRSSYQELEYWSSNLSTDEGQPTAYAYYAKQLRLYPIPDAAYAVRVSGVFSLATLSADSDTNAWMTDAEALIRTRAKREILTHVIRDLEAAGVMNQVEQEQLKSLIEANTFRSSTGTILATEF